MNLPSPVQAPGALGECARAQCLHGYFKRENKQSQAQMSISILRS